MREGALLVHHYISSVEAHALCLEAGREREGGVVA